MRTGSRRGERDYDVVHDDIQQQSVGDAERYGAAHEDRPAARDEVVGQRHGAGDEEMKEEAEGGGGGAPLETRLAEEAGGHRLEDPGGRQVRLHRPEDASIDDVEGSGEEAARERQRPWAIAVRHGDVSRLSGRSGKARIGDGGGVGVSHNPALPTWSQARRGRSSRNRVSRRRRPTHSSTAM